MLDIKIIYQLALGNMKARYRKTFAGFLWVVLNPLILFMIQSFVFKNFLRLDVPNYHLFLITGLLPWIFFTSSVEMCTPVIDASRELLKGINLSPFNLVLAQVLDNIFNFTIVFFVVLVPWLISTGAYSWKLLLIPFAFLNIIVSVSSLVIILSILNIFYRDIRYLSSFILNILFFLTPIFYPRSFIPDPYKIIVDINPIYVLLTPFRYCFLEIDESFLILILKSSCITFTMVFLTLRMWKKRKNEFYLRL
ncbi:MAG: ABC transporter permease [Bacteriovoracaceae bacterium]|jgi:lipopolysaccharide transport system permease protein|nr:ABC transporter permease [Bacteriovoracaceae bacterium]